MIRNIELKILDSRALLPEYGTKDSAGVDLVACMDKGISIPPLKSVLISTGLAINMQTVPETCVAMIFPRSGKGHKEGIVLGNSVGIIDQDYHGQLMVSVLNRNSELYVNISPGDKIAQLVFMPIFKSNFIKVDEFSSTTARGEGGFGSTGS